MTALTAGPATAQQVLAWAIERFGRRLVITTSFQAGGMAVIDIAARLSKDIRVATLDTGRLPGETYHMIEVVRKRYDIPVEVICPDTEELEAMVTRHGPNLFYDSVAHRLLCCEIRKKRPMERALRDADAWVVGLRREQSETRSQLEMIEEVDGKVKISPLANWSREQLDRYLLEYDVPRHPLYDRGYTSIGCAPCTRPTESGEDERAGRWWWEEGTARECGLHFSPDGRAERTVDVLLREVLESA